MTVEGVIFYGRIYICNFAFQNGFFGITNPLMGLLLAFIGGMLAGLTTGILHTKFNIENLSVRILVGTGLYSMNFRITGKSNVIIPTSEYLWIG